MVPWYSLFSHTGSETLKVKELCKDYVHLEQAITNNMDYDGPLDVVKLRTGHLINEWLKAPGNVKPNSIITLNGFMRILPSDVLDSLAEIGCRVFNIHPAPIQTYPELRGADPQERLYKGLKEGQYSVIGAVIHEVDAGVDTGEVIHWVTKLPPVSFTKDTIYEELHDLGTEMWHEFFERRMHLDG